MMKNKKLLAAIIITIVFAASAVLAVIALVSSAGTDPVNTRSGIALIASAYADPKTGQTVGATGTGWAIGEQGKPVSYFVTNGHVVQGVYTYGGTLKIFYSVAENDSVSPQIIYYSAPEDKDIAILKLPEPTTKRTALKIRPSAGVKIGESAYALGYPGVAMDSQSYNSLDENDITVTKGIISKSASPLGVKFEAFQMDVSINHGNSGGPLVDESGFVIGINTLGSNQTENMNFAIKSDELTRILREEGINYTAKGSNGWMTFVFIPVALLAAAGAVILFISASKKTAVQSSSNADAPFAARPQPTAGRSAVARGISGVYAGEKFPLNSRLTFGRNSAECNVVFAADAPGISAVHCTLIYDPADDRFVLTDSGSSYGTFLGNGRKLAANIPEKLVSGDTFYLADPTTKFSVGKE